MRALLRAADAAEAPPGRRRGRGDLPEARARSTAPDWIETATVTLPVRPHRRRALRDRARAGRLGGESRHDRLPPWPSRRARRRASRRAAHRRRSRSPARRSRDAKQVAAVVHETLDELGFVGWPKTSGNRGIHVYVPDRAELGLPRRAPLRARVRARGRAARAEARHDRLVEGGARRAGLHRLQPERARPDDRVGLLGARPARRDRLGAGHAGTSSPTSRPRTSPWRRCRRASRSSATSRPASTTPSATCARCSSGSSATRREGVGEAPYPPNFPKMPGEPKRVQPSRAKKS